MFRHRHRSRCPDKICHACYGRCTAAAFFTAEHRGKKITAAFDGGRISSDGGVLLAAAADRRIGLIDTLAALIPDHRDPAQITHTLADILRARVFAIACGYPDADDLDDLRRDPAFKLACGRLPESGDDLASQPTMSRWENAPDIRTLIRLSHAMVDLWCSSHRRAPEAITLDIDDTADTVHGHQQLSLFNAHHDEYCFLPIHIYDAATGHCVLTILRPGKTPDGKEVRGHLHRLVRRIRRHWPRTRITIRCDSHYGRAAVQLRHRRSADRSAVGLHQPDMLGLRRHRRGRPGWAAVLLHRLRSLGSCRYQRGDQHTTARGQRMAAWWRLRMSGTSKQEPSGSLRSAAAGTSAIHGQEDVRLDPIRHLHRVLMMDTDYRHPEEPGEWRSRQNWIGARRIEDATSIPPPASHLESCLLHLEGFLQVDLDSPMSLTRNACVRPVGIPPIGATIRLVLWQAAETSA